MGIKLSAYYHGRFVQMIRTADGIMDKLKALEYYEKHMEEVEADFLTEAWRKDDDNGKAS
ncbi:hypothetical protein [Cohnella zeiphila]|uniref:Uncharacterized protein n=1 Tax=Cohnella zeiphila TaxID=2761120 RepID=A0A7X0SKZ8_9BACL|nr:hypothetical protein [Cohnella zeiphila]MBB6731923.1 hypothetical protein [Cohnella zeiphila]